MLNTSMYKKLEQMKKGGYTLFSDKTRKMLLAMGLSLLSVGTITQVANAEVAGTVDLKRTANLDTGKIRYQLTLNEDEYNLDGIYDATGATRIDPIAGKINAKTGTVVIEVADSTESVMIKNTNPNPTEGTDTKVITLTTENVDNDGPTFDAKTMIKYNTEEGSYIQAKFTDAKTKIYKIVDKNGHDRVVLKEKEQDKTVTLKYVLLDENDTSFKIYDILGNYTTINLSDAKIETTFNAKSIDGSKIALDVTTQYIDGANTYNLTGIMTPAGQEITVQDADKDIYPETGTLPQGITKLVLTYTNANDTSDTKTVEIPIALDKTAPVAIKYQKESDGNGTQTVTKSTASTAQSRAYINSATGKGIVEVKDIQSGISKIVTLTGSGAYTEEATVYETTDLKISVLCLFNVSQNTTAVRVYDGVGNSVDIPLVESTDVVTYAKINKHNDGTYTLVAQNVNAGLSKIERATGVDGQNNPVFGPGGELATFADPDALNNAGNLKQYPLERYEQVIADTGEPIIRVYDALGNMSEVTFDTLAITLHYAAYNGTDALALSLTETRGIWKIAAVVQEESGTNTYVLETFPEGNEPQTLTKTYAIPQGSVLKVFVYNERGTERLKNEISGSDIKSEAQLTALEKIYTSQDRLAREGTSITGTTAIAKFGIKQIEYGDGTIVKFYEELPTELFINCKVKEGNSDILTTAVVTDALGHYLTIDPNTNETGDVHGRVTYSYNDNIITL